MSSTTPMAKAVFASKSHYHKIHQQAKIQFSFNINKEQYDLLSEEVKEVLRQWHAFPESKSTHCRREA